LSEGNLSAALEEGLEKKFKISTAINTSNMVCFDGRGRIKKYNSPEEILKEFYEYRLEYYHKRKVRINVNCVFMKIKINLFCSQ
jgi:DNA topoisomerase-2